MTCRRCRDTGLMNVRGQGPGGWAKAPCVCIQGPPAPHVHPLAIYYGPTRYMAVTIIDHGRLRHAVVDLLTSEYFGNDQTTQNEAMALALVCQRERE